MADTPENVTEVDKKVFEVKKELFDQVAKVRDDLYILKTKFEDEKQTFSKEKNKYDIKLLTLIGIGGLIAVILGYTNIVNLPKMVKSEAEAEVKKQMPDSIKDFVDNSKAEITTAVVNAKVQSNAMTTETTSFLKKLDEWTKSPPIEFLQLMKTTKNVEGGKMTLIYKSTHPAARYGSLALVTLYDEEDPNLSRSDLVHWSVPDSDYIGREETFFSDRQIQVISGVYSGNGIVDTITTPWKDIISTYTIKTFKKNAPGFELYVKTNNRKSKMTVSVMVITPSLPGQQPTPAIKTPAPN